MSTPIASNSSIDTSLVSYDAIPWVELLPGIEIRMLRTGEGSGTYTVMSRFGPGTVLPKHYHLGCVHAYTISGEWFYQEYDWVAGPASYIYEPPGSTHTLAVADTATEPAVIIFVIDQGMEIYGPNDEVLTVETAESITKMYKDVLKTKGIPLPSGMLP